ncbi:hypothetical protein [Aquipuribacter sp. MA13-6]|uniref:hypothetical protein n=1 Tax=unclassified Aquipuribacter TaxID=2635084 RepID=UPI003EEE45F0
MPHPRPDAELLLATRTGLHAVAEGVLAGPQHRSSGTIRLSAAPGAIETVAEPRLRLTPSTVSGPAGEASLLGATSVMALGAAVGVQAGPPDGLYGDTSGVEVDQALSIDADTATALMDWFAVGAAGLLTFAPDERAVLWPEHFDLAITLDGVNYGVSPGDAFSPVPYAYVGPHTRVEDPFFDAPFGAVRTWEQTPDAASLAAFFAEGRERSQAVDAGA